ncbi:MAG: RHS repeat-associated core domain-containing protein [Phycisphaerales bacterium]
MNYTLTHDAAGNLTDDGQNYKYVYGVFGRLVTVKNQSNNMVAKYAYDALGQRISTHTDVGGNGSVTTADHTYWFVYDDRWRIIATYRCEWDGGASKYLPDTEHKEQFVWHNAGMDGRGGSSYIDSVILRDRDNSSGWAAASDGALEERRFYLQNWRADVSAVCNTNGRPLERVKYSAYGTPITLTDLDFNADGNIDPDDPGDFINNPYDWNLDGSVDSADDDDFFDNYSAVSGNTYGRGYLSLSAHGNRIGYAGYIYDRFISGPDGGKWHVRHRVLDSGIGRWTRRDPLGYVDGPSLLNYVSTDPLGRYDSLGLLPCESTEFTVAWGFSESKTVFAGPIPVMFGIGFAFQATLTRTWCPCGNGRKELSIELAGVYEVNGFVGVGVALPASFCSNPLSFCASGWIGGRAVGRASGGVSGGGVVLTCDGEESSVRICIRPTVTVAGEIGGEASISWRGFGPYTVGIVGYLRGTAWGGVCFTCNGDGCRDYTWQFGGYSASIGWRFCFGFWCKSFDTPLGESTIGTGSKTR